jgi:hypothetical protein
MLTHERATSSRCQNRARTPKKTIRFCRYRYVNRRTALYHAHPSLVRAVIRTQMVVYAMYTGIQCGLESGPDGLYIDVHPHGIHILLSAAISSHQET